MPYPATRQGGRRSAEGIDEWGTPIEAYSTPRLRPDHSDETSVFTPAKPRLQAGGEPIPGYRLVAQIGKGGSGEVWRVTGPGGFPAALKIIPLSDAEAAVEMRSLELLRDIRHANLVTVFGAWQDHGALIVAMELADRSLWARFREAMASTSASSTATSSPITCY